jgi:hypothetical protein
MPYAGLAMLIYADRQTDRQTHVVAVGKCCALVGMTANFKLRDVCLRFPLRALQGTTERNVIHFRLLSFFRTG